MEFGYSGGWFSYFSSSSFDFSPESVPSVCEMKSVRSEVKVDERNLRLRNLRNLGVLTSTVTSSESGIPIEHDRSEKCHKNLITIFTRVECFSSAGHKPLFPFIFLQFLFSLRAPLRGPIRDFFIRTQCAAQRGTKSAYAL